MISCGIASIPAREMNLKLILERIAPQVNVTYVALNGYKEFPLWQDEFSNVFFYLTDNRLGDAEKFRFASKSSGYFLTLDDDLLPCKGYVDNILEGVDKYDGLVSYHGKKYLTPVTSFRNWAGNYRCLGTVSEDIRSINVIGSGCCAFNTARLDVPMSAFKRANMADIFISKLASDQYVPMVVLKHEKDYFEYLKPPEGTTIWEQTSNYRYHLEVMKTFIK